MNVDGIQLYPRTYAAASTAALPTSVAVQIGKGLKGLNVNVYKSAGKDIPGSVDFDIFNNGSGTITKQGIIRSYDENTGVLLMDAGYTTSTVVNSSSFLFSDNTLQNNGYLVINASKSPFVMGFGIANNTEAAAGVISDKFITPQTLKGGLNASGSAPIYAARAWVNFIGTTGVIRASGNVSSVSDNGVGDFTLNFTTALPDTNYTFVASSSANSGDTTVFHPTVSNTYGLSTTNLRINCRGQDRVTLADVTQAMIAIFR
jgi:hypothetical protein